MSSSVWVLTTRSDNCSHFPPIKYHFFIRPSNELHFPLCLPNLLYSIYSLLLFLSELTSAAAFSTSSISSPLPIYHQLRNHCRPLCQIVDTIKSPQGEQLQLFDWVFRTRLREAETTVSLNLNTTREDFGEHFRKWKPKCFFKYFNRIWRCWRLIWVKLRGKLVIWSRIFWTCRHQTEKSTSLGDVVSLKINTSYPVRRHLVRVCGLNKLELI